MRTFDETELTTEVRDSFEHARSPRAREVLEKLVTHLHAFVRDVEPTFDEWMLAIDFLTRTGHMSGAARQEFILLSDTLGVSMLVDAINHRVREGATETTVLGPFYVGAHPQLAHGTDLADGADGEPLYFEGSVCDVRGTPLPGATVDVWHADAAGLYDAQKPGYQGDRPSMRGRFVTDDRGRFAFRTILPCSYPIPTDGPVGELLRAGGRDAMRPAHIHFFVRAPSFEPLVTHVFVEGDRYLAEDVVYGVKPELVAPVAAQQTATFPDGAPAPARWHRMTFAFAMKSTTDAPEVPSDIIGT